MFSNLTVWIVTWWAITILPSAIGNLFDGLSLGQLLESIGVFGEADVDIVVDVAVEVEVVVDVMVDVVVDMVLGERSGKLMQISKVEFVVDTLVGKHVVDTLVVETHVVETLER